MKIVHTRILQHSKAEWVEKILTRVSTFQHHISFAQSERDLLQEDLIRYQMEYKLGPMEVSQLQDILSSTEL